MPHLIYRNPQADIHAITISVVDNGAPLVDGAIYEVDAAHINALTASGHWSPVDEIEGLIDVDGISDKLATALAFIGIHNRAQLKAEFDADDGARLAQIPGIGDARLAALREWAQGDNDDA